MGSQHQSHSWPPPHDPRASGPPTMSAPGPLATHHLHNQPSGGIPGADAWTDRKARPQGKEAERVLGILFPTPGRSPTGSAE